jgi:adenine-specific DNA-methyltransferase
MEKLKLHTPDLVAANIDKIAVLFPGSVTEHRETNGLVTRTVDFDQLRQELSASIVEGPQERYRLDWPGKRESLLVANAPIAKTLRPCREESVAFDTTKNLFIEGDNLDALKLLQESYLGKIKFIYIDPPYNTGKEFIYDDDFSENTQSYFQRSNQKDDTGNRLVANTEANGRFHSDWLSMMYPRLKLARNLLKDSGILFVSIGQEEISNTYRLCSELFGETNFVTICSRVAKKGGQKGTHFSPCVDYIVAFAKNIFELNPFREEISANLIDQVYTKVEVSGPRKGERYRSMGLYQAMLDTRANQRYYIECPDGTLVIPPGISFPNVAAEGNQIKPNDGDGVWRWTYDRFKREKIERNIEFLESERTSLVCPDGKPSKWNIYYKIWLNDRLESGQLPGNILEKFESRHSSAELKVLNIPFDFPKPSALIKFLMTISGVESGDITLDFFAGSGTTAHAAIELAAETNEPRPFVCVQLPEKTKEESAEYKEGFRNIAEICKERIRRAGQNLKTAHATDAAKLDIGFRVLKIETSNMKDVYYKPDAVSQADLLAQADNIREDRTPEDLLFQVLIDWGIDLTLPIAKEVIAGKTAFFVDSNALAACFDADISEELVTALAKRREHGLPLLKVVFRDASYRTDSVKINVEQIFKLLSPTTDIRTL